jgi:hypothetical protein
MMELEVSAKLGAAPHERTAERTGYRNRHRIRAWDTRPGTIELEIPELRERRLDEHRSSYLWLDAEGEKVRQGGRIVSMAVHVAVAVNECGEGEVLGLEVGPAETGSLWTGVLRSFVARGLSGVGLVTWDAHVVSARRSSRRSWGAVGPTRCGGRLGPRAEGRPGPRRGAREDDLPPARRALGHAQLSAVVEQLGNGSPSAAEVLLRAEEEVLASRCVPRAPVEGLVDQPARAVQPRAPPSD